MSTNQHKYNNSIAAPATSSSLLTSLILTSSSNHTLQMENVFGISNSKGHKHSNLSPMHNYALLQSPYSHQLGQMDMVDQYLSHDVHNTALRNLNTSDFRYLQSGRSVLASPLSVSENRPPVGYMYKHSSGNRRIESRMESPGRSRLSLPFGIAPMKLEEDVVVFDGVSVNNVPVDRARSSSLSLTDSGSSSSSSGKSYKAAGLCLSYLQNSGFCHYGSKCQFAHVNKELHPVPFAYKSMIETPCKSYSLSGSCSYGSKCRFLHHETSMPTSSTTRAISQIKPDDPTTATSRTVNLKSRNWSPVDDDIEIQLKQDFDSCVNKVLYGPQRIMRLRAFTQICPE